VSGEETPETRGFVERGTDVLGTVLPERSAKTVRRTKEHYVARRLSAEQRDIIVAALPFSIALMEALPAHLVPRPLLRSDAEDLFAALGGDDRLIAGGRREVETRLQEPAAGEGHAKHSLKVRAQLRDANRGGPDSMEGVKISLATDLYALRELSQGPIGILAGPRRIL
jgi:hypothetical protein